ncbi:hypothetical protein GGR55DRAFT_477237 [Xylaria sp. FL0064]|nr:hypothetical protein GGR55DRAFT_477237 [Xylaria sp. FL0064]
MSSPASAARSTYDGEFNTNNSVVTNGDVNNNNNSDINTGNINNNGDFNTNNNSGASANANSDITDSGGASVIQGGLDSATRTMYITTLVLLAIQFLALCALLAIWLRKRTQRRRRERQKIEEQGGGAAGYLYPTVGYWGLPSDAQQQMGTQAHRGQNPWYDVPHPAGARREMSA